jgi:CubicO group peptidase (beta-lactamase class C family)
MDAYAEALGSLPLMRQPGEFWLYDTGMQLLGVLIERAAGQPLGDFMAERLFEPLGMVDTGFFVPAAKLDRLAGIWWRNHATGVLERFDGIGAESRFAAPPGFASASGGLVSTADDYLAFARMMANGGRLGAVRILSAESVARMSRDQIAPEVKARSPFAPGFWEAGGWGYGMQAVTNPMPGYPRGCGWAGGYGTSGYWDAETGLIGIHLTQGLMESPAPTAVFADFWTGARAAAGV